VTRIPPTRPSWTAGTWDLWQDGLPVGSFRLFLSALRWRDYLVATTAAREFAISQRGTTVNLWRREQQGSIDVAQWLL